MSARLFDMRRWQDEAEDARRSRRAQYAHARLVAVRVRKTR